MHIRFIVVFILSIIVATLCEAKKHTVKNHCQMDAGVTEACTCYGNVVGVCTESEVCTKDGCKSASERSEHANARFRRKE